MTHVACDGIFMLEVGNLHFCSTSSITRLYSNWLGVSLMHKLLHGCMQLKQELDQRLQEAQHNLAQQLEAVSALQGQLADAGTAAEISKAQSDSSIAAKQAQLTQAQDTIRTFPLLSAHMFNSPDAVS